MKKIFVIFEFDNFTRYIYGFTYGVAFESIIGRIIDHEYLSTLLPISFTALLTMIVLRIDNEPLFNKKNDSISNKTPPPQ